MAYINGNMENMFFEEWICLCVGGSCVFPGISCMAQDCSLQMPEDFVLPLLPGEELKDKYRRYLFRDYVEVCVCFSFLNLQSGPEILSQRHNSLLSGFEDPHS